MIFLRLSALVLLFFVCACESPKITDANRQSASTNFSLTTLAEAQQKQFMATLPRVKKQTEEAEKTVESDEKLWTEVFGSLKDGDIFRPIFKGRYTEEAISHTHSRYTALEESLSVRELVLIFEDSAKTKPKKVTLRVQEENLLFKRQKEVQFTFTEGSLQTYSVRSQEDVRGLSPKETRLVLTVLP